MSHNLAQCKTLVQKAVDAGVKALFLPEASDYISSSPQQAMSLLQPASQSHFVTGLQALARSNSLYINVGIHEPTTPPSSRLSNTLVWITPSGEIAHRYAKLHVFDIDLSATGGPKLKESNTTEPGQSLSPTFDISVTAISDSSNKHDEHVEHSKQQLLKFGSLICFDLRFPEPALALTRNKQDPKKQANILLYPSAFTVPTGKLHWETLLRARAIENQCFVIASAQCGRHNEKRVSYGDSMVVDPNGIVLGRLEHVESETESEAPQPSSPSEYGGQDTKEPSLLIVDLDMSIVEKVRRSLPLLRRADVYS